MLSRPWWQVCPATKIRHTVAKVQAASERVGDLNRELMNQQNVNKVVDNPATEDRALEKENTLKEKLYEAQMTLILEQSKAINAEVSMLQQD